MFDFKENRQEEMIYDVMKGKFSVEFVLGNVSFMYKWGMSLCVHT